MTVPYTFGNESSPIPLSQLDANFASIPAFANTAGNVANAAQPTITSLGVLTSLSVAGNISVANVTINNAIITTGNASAGNISTTGIISAYGTVTGGNFTTGGNVTANNITANTQISTGGNVVGGNIITGGQVSAIGDIHAQGQVSAIGNIVTAGYFIGNFQGNITGNLSVGGSNTQILFNSNGNVGAAGGLTYNSGSNTLSILGNVSAQGNVSAGNIIVGGGSFTRVVTAPTAPIGTANNQIATTAFVNSATGTLGGMAYQSAASVAITGGTIGNVILNSATISFSNVANTIMANSTISNTSILGGNISTANIVSLASPLMPAYGGTGVASLTQNSLLVGNGTAAIQTVAPGTAGNILGSDGTNWISISGPSAVVGLGFGGTSWHNVTSSRSFNSLYVNSRSYPIAVSATATCAVTSTIQAYVNSVLIAWYQWQFNGCGSFGGTFIIVPPGATYQLNSGQGVYNWIELY
jgi:hypothetical protein